VASALGSISRIPGGKGRSLTEATWGMVGREGATKRG